jgi:hypothetical protein
MLILLGATGPVTADIAPIPEPGPPPPGPAEAVIRGLMVAQTYTYFQGRRWMVEITGCQGGACDLARCFVVGVGGNPIADGDVRAVMKAEAKAGDAPLILDLDNCSQPTVTLAKAPVF